MNVVTEFQYISCYCLSWKDLRVQKEDSHFNTSHVTVYPFNSLRSTAISYISIHLMLLFIKKVLYIVLGVNHFNTSHVTVYLLEELIDNANF